jgi:hypothetical protein
VTTIDSRLEYAFRLREADAAQDDMIVEGERYLVEHDGGRWYSVVRIEITVFG